MTDMPLTPLEELAVLIRERKFPERYEPRGQFYETTYTLVAIALIGEAIIYSLKGT